MQYFDDISVVTGHTPTQEIKSNSRPGYIYKGNNHIAVDCGYCRPDEQLAALCPDTGKEYYASNYL